MPATPRTDFERFQLTTKVMQIEWMTPKAQAASRELLNDLHNVTKSLGFWETKLHDSSSGLWYAAFFRFQLFPVGSWRVRDVLCCGRA